MRGEVERPLAQVRAKLEAEEPGRTRWWGWGGRRTAAVRGSGPVEPLPPSRRPIGATGGGELLPDLAPRDRPRDHEPLNLRGALEDRVDLRVPVPALDRELARVAVAAEDVHRALGGPHRVLAGLELAHRALGGLEWPAG